MQSIKSFAAEHRVLVDLIGLVLSLVVVHSIYVLYVIPSSEQLMAMAQASGELPPRTIALIFKDFEQEVACVLALWCLWLWTFRYRLFQDEYYLMQMDDFLGISELTVVNEASLDKLQQTVRQIATEIPGSNLVSSLDVAINNLRENGSFREAAQAGTEACELHLETLDSDLSITKYILWAIPSVGFLGTVRGIGEALGRANEAVAGDIAGVASSLGVAFNSTFVALGLSLFLMFISYILQGREEKLVVGFKNLIANDLVAPLSVLARTRPQAVAPTSSSSQIE